MIILFSFKSMDDSPPPLKHSLATAVVRELQQGRGDPSEARRLESALAFERERVAALQKVIADKDKELETTVRLLELQHNELEKKYFATQEENAKLRAAAKPQDVTHFEEVFRLINRQRKALERDRETLDSDRVAFAAEKLKFENLRSDRVKQAFSLATAEAAQSAIIAQRVHEFIKKLENSSKEEIREIRASLEGVLAEKLAEIDNYTYSVVPKQRNSEIRNRRAIY